MAEARKKQIADHLSPEDWNHLLTFFNPTNES